MSCAGSQQTGFFFSSSFHTQLYTRIGLSRRHHYRCNLSILSPAQSISILRSPSSYPRVDHHRACPLFSNITWFSSLSSFNMGPCFMMIAPKIQSCVLDYQRLDERLFDTTPSVLIKLLATPITTKDPQR